MFLEIEFHRGVIFNFPRDIGETRQGCHHEDVQALHTNREFLSTLVEELSADSCPTSFPGSLTVTPWKFDVLKQIIAREAKLRGKYAVLRTSNFQGATVRPIVSTHKHSIVFNYCSPLNFLPRASLNMILNYFHPF